MKNGVKPFSTIIEYETLPYLVYSFHIQMFHFDENFKYLGPCISDIQHMMSLDYHSQLCSSRSVEEVFHPTLYGTDKSLMMHFNKTEAGRWTCMICIPEFHNIYCLSSHLKHEGMNYIADNFKISRIIGVTNIIVKRISNVLVCPKKCLSKCKDRL